MTIQEIEKSEDQSAGPDATVASDQKPTRVAKPMKSGKRGAKTKREQLVTLLSKTNGARISTITQKLRWQAHTVRAAISGLRKRGHEVVTSKSPKTGETVYTIDAISTENVADVADAAEASV